MASVTLSRAAALLAEQDGIIILCHRYPDGDTIGSAFALCRALRALGKKANVICGDLIPPKYSYIHEGMTPVAMRERFVVAVDVASENMLGVLEKDYAKRVNLCIDHHATNSRYAANYLIDANAAATGEVIYRLIKKLGVEVDKPIASALYTAISTDTGCFRYANVTAATHRIASELIAVGIDAAQINRVMFEIHSRGRMAIERSVLDSLEYRLGGRVAFVSLTEKMISEAGASEGDLDGIASIPRKIEGVVVGVLMRETAEGYKISVRTAPGASASEICARLGGGGHPAAAGALVKGTLEMVRDSVLESVVRELGED